MDWTVTRSKCTRAPAHVHHTDPQPPSEGATARPESPQHAAASAFPSTIAYLLTGHEKVWEGYVQ